MVPCLFSQLARVEHFGPLHILSNRNPALLFQASTECLPRAMHQARRACHPPQPPLRSAMISFHLHASPVKKVLLPWLWRSEADVLLKVTQLERRRRQDSIPQILTASSAQARRWEGQDRGAPTHAHSPPPLVGLLTKTLCPHLQPGHPHNSAT